MGSNPNGPCSVSCDRAIKYSGLGVRSVGPVGDFLESLSFIFPTKYGILESFKVGHWQSEF